jgi:hypothetical protein
VLVLNVGVVSVFCIGTCWCMLVLLLHMGVGASCWCCYFVFVMFHNVVVLQCCYFMGVVALCWFFFGFLG